MCYADTLSVEAAAKLMHKNASFIRKGLQASWNDVNALGDRTIWGA